MKQLLFFLIIIQCVSGCANGDSKENKIYKRLYYDNGVLMKEGLFNDKMQPVDTLKSYSPEGKLKLVEVYDTSGKLNGLSELYYANGKVEQTRYFVADVMNGPLNNYYESGKIKSSGYVRSGFFQGDRYHYYENGQYKGFNFLDFQEHNFIAQIFDSSTNKIVERRGDQIVIDSISYEGDSVYLSFLLAHPPFTKNEITIKELTKEDKIIRTAAVPDSSGLFNLKFLKSPDLFSIILNVMQYDSATGKKLPFTNRYNLVE